MSTMTAPAIRISSSARANEARRAVLLAGVTTQRQALAARERALAEAEACPSADPGSLHSLRMCVAWHRDTLARLSGRLAA